MTTILTHLICFAAGLLVSIVLAWVIYEKQRRAWHKEYRRLMCGIKEARIAALDGNHRHSIDILMRMLIGEPIWPRE